MDEFAKKQTKPPNWVRSNDMERNFFIPYFLDLIPFRLNLSKGVLRTTSALTSTLP
jgi:hypothetical protein